MKDRTASSSTTEKEIVGKAAANVIEDGMVVGLGTGSTTAYAIKELGRRVFEENLEILAVPTSYQSEMLSIEAGIPLTTLSQHPVLDIAIDGADQIDSDLNAVKGGGGAHTREKVVSMSANHFIVVVDESKISDRLDHYIPVEVLSYSRNLVCNQIKTLGGNPTTRMATRKDGPVITDNGNFIIDASFGVIEDPLSLSKELSGCTGVVEHGIFHNVSEVYIGKKDGSFEIIS
ncbi:ribose 5-phosphate isomerase [Methanosalsum zhilinae DSM 4017]|uniref:Ribose-5-phosphate isomerase A n=1 Tax=Methanosalsum zhilinae (strain DSM 4017 / NBRC 107636 / OCM 62 / WeN5) TaxID=679901 RepID=F7XM76_METZD|nr:ribose 5-phosphate isomerase A [Methanosalsum zhilinae]AEH60965.1 ribose 5-phosphate isomerase [Methanosalsum zhilinae DSM 4017]